MNLAKNWWKIVAALLLLYVIPATFLMPAPDELGILGKSIRNLNFHVPMWFSMFALLAGSYVYSLIYLKNGKMSNDSRASSLIKVAILFGIMGLMTGSFWARFTWGAWWPDDPKMKSVAIGMLVYLAYYVLRKSIDDDVKTAKLTAVYNLFAFPVFMVVIVILPRMMETGLHPASGDTVGFNQYDMDNNLKKVFYLAVPGWILLGFWISSLKYRISELARKRENKEIDL